MGKIKNALKNFKWGYLLFAFLFLGAGIAFIAFPEQGLKVVKLVIGIVAIVFAGIYIALTIAKKERGLAFWSSIVMGVVCIICGGLVILVNSLLLEYLLTAFGIVLMVDASFKLQTAMMSKRYKSPLWWVLLSLAAATLVFGILLMKGKYDFSKAEEELVLELTRASRTLGIGLVLDGLANFFSIILLYAVEKGTKQAVIESLQAEGKMPLFLENEKLPTLEDSTLTPAPAPLVVEPQEAPATEPEEIASEVTPEVAEEAPPVVVEVPALEAAEETPETEPQPEA